MKDTEESHFEFMESNAEAFRKMASEGYAAEGRGAIVCYSSMPAPRDLWNKAQLTGRQNLPGFTQAAYISDKAARKSIGWPDAVTARMVGDYDPEKQIVVIINRADGRVSAYKVRLVSNPLYKPEDGKESPG